MAYYSDEDKRLDKYEQLLRDTFEGYKELDVEVARMCAEVRLLANAELLKVKCEAAELCEACEKLIDEKKRQNAEQTETVDSEIVSQKSSSQQVAQ